MGACALGFENVSISLKSKLGIVSRAFFECSFLPLLPCDVQTLFSGVVGRQDFEKAEIAARQFLLPVPLQFTVAVEPAKESYITNQGTVVTGSILTFSATLN